jgi:hypothetical protein
MKYQLRFDDGYTEAVIGEIEVDLSTTVSKKILLLKETHAKYSLWPTLKEYVLPFTEGKLQFHTASCCSLVEENA